MHLSRSDCERLGIDWEAGRLAGPGATTPPRPARVPGTMNATERRYADRLERRRLAGEIAAWEYEPERLRLGPTCEYLPDFRVTMPDGSIQYHECKGKHIWEDSIVKVKWAASKYHPTPFYLCRWRHGRWSIRRIDGGPAAGEG